MKLLPLDSINYLSSLQGMIPNTRVGLSFDGQRLGVVCFSIIDDPRATPIPRVIERKRTYVGSFPILNSSPPPKKPTRLFVWYADNFEGIGISGVYGLLNQVLELSTGKFASDVGVYAKGQRETWSFAKESKRGYGVSIREFAKKAYGYWSDEEVAMAVLDDLNEERITPAPEFRGRPEFEILNSVLRNLKIGDAMDPLAEAALYGFGYWSALEQRAKWGGWGSTNHALY